MKKFNLNKDFIEGYYVSKSACDNLINFFEKSNVKEVGTTADGIDKKRKESTDVYVNINAIPNYSELNNYFNELSKCLKLYKSKYKFCDKGVTYWQLEEQFNIQKYKPGEAFHAWHCEKDNISSSRRHLVWMTYLNDVKKGGETEWYYQKLKIKPKKGLTVIWPAEWNFTHRGKKTINEDKYIITGWYKFII